MHIQGYLLQYCNSRKLETTYMYIKKKMIERIMVYLLYTMKYAELSRILCSNSKGIHGLLLNEKEKT